MGVRAVLEEDGKDLALRRDRSGVSRAAASGVLNGEMQCGGAGIVFECGVRTRFDETRRCCRTAGSHRAMEGGGTVFIDQPKVGTGRHQRLQRRDLARRVPGPVADIAIGGVVQGRRSPVWAAAVGRCAGGEQLLHNLFPMPGGGEMQRRVSTVNPMVDAGFVKPRRGYRSRRQSRVRTKDLPDVGHFIGDDRLK